LEKVSSVRDGMVLEGKLNLPDCTDNDFVHAIEAGAAISENSCSHGSATFSALEKKRPGGSKGERPTISRDNSPYEMRVKRSRFCPICREQGHKSCPQRGDAPKTPRKSPRCSSCGLTGHRECTCCGSFDFIMFFFLTGYINGITINSVIMYMINVLFVW
jgi:hypothetical protein